ncbi:hypothetical protein [Legionella drancourtii]|uniref:hypothetical protein n=1 Tax=Legionella drancourtii TaxID=168933 RepID=UPI000A001E35|nr:hypothetical protein [Legionella drancourtii]
MEQVNVKSYRIMPILLISFLVLMGALYTTVAKADTPSSSSPAGMQLAYYIGYHSAPGYVYYGPRYYPRHPRKLYWTGWRYIGHGCRKNCLVDRWSGRVIRCNRTCRR